MLSILLVLQANAQTQAAGSGYTSGVDQAYLDHLDLLDLLADRDESFAADYTAETPQADTSSDTAPEPLPPEISDSFNVLLSTSAPACSAGDSSRTEYGFTSETTRKTSKTADVGFTAIVTPNGQIDIGLVSVFAGNNQAGTPVGQVLAYAPNLTSDARVEAWFWDTSFNFDEFGGSYSLRMDAPQATPTDVVELLDAKVADWEQKPYAPILFDYITKPKKSDTDLAVYPGPKVYRYHFELYQGSTMVGAMLRERHTWGGQTKFVVEHWLFFEGFKQLKKKGDRVNVTKTNNAPPDTASFFSAYDGCIIDTYAQPIYDHGGTGDDFLAQPLLPLP